MILKYGFDIDPEQKVYSMTVSQKQTLEIVKVLYRGADILILDEPTAVLTPQETEKLFGVMREMKKDGKAILMPLKAIDFNTIGLLIGLFLMIGGITNMGVIDALANLLAKAGGNNIFLLYTKKSLCSFRNSEVQVLICKTNSEASRYNQHERKHFYRMFFL